MAEREEESSIASGYIVAYKLILGTIESISGIMILVFGKRATAFYRIYVARELSEDPHDLFVRLTTRLVPFLITHQVYFEITLLLFGLVKIAGAIGLLYRRHWGVDLIVGLTVIMFPFQTVELIRSPSIFTFLYIALGLIISLYLVHFEPQHWVHRMHRRITGQST